MRRSLFNFKFEQTTARYFSWGDVLVVIALIGFVYIGIHLAVYTPTVIKGPNISLSPKALPWYTILSIARMAAAYLLSVLFSVIYGRIAANSKKAQKYMLPLLDVLQSVPILSFLPVVVLSLRAVLPQNIAAELGSIILIFTSQVWNMTFSWYQSLTTVPKELKEASSIFKLNNWLKFKTLEVPFAMISFVWNSMMSWAGGWFFLMAAEIFTVGDKDFRLPGLGSYLQQAAAKGDMTAIFWGIGTLIFVIVMLDQFIWRPLLSWSDRFKVETVEGEDVPTSWFYNLLRDANLLGWMNENVFLPVREKIDQWLGSSLNAHPNDKEHSSWPGYMLKFVPYILLASIVFGSYNAGLMLVRLSPKEWSEIGLGLSATLLRVFAALIIALAWTIPLGVAIGTNKRLANFLQPMVQILASIPATALFPVFLLFLIALPGGLNIAAVLLMLLGTQWYLLFNIIAGASAIPQDLKYTAKLLHLNKWQRWKTLILPALFPYLITGSIAASGGAWNASIVAEYVNFGGKIMSTNGIGAIISESTAAGNYPMLLASTLSMILTVVLINRFLWRRLYRLAEEQYRLD